MLRIINVGLLIATLVGACLLVSRQNALSTILREHKRLAAVVGVLEIEDPTKFKLTRVDTGDPTHYCWRVYYPKNANYQMASSSFWAGEGSSSAMRSDAGEILLRYRLEFVDDSKLCVHRMLGGSGGMSKQRDAAMIAFLKENWASLEVNAIDELEFNEDEVVDLLRIELTPEHREFLKASKGRGLKRLQKTNGPIARIQFGGVRAFKLAKEKSAASGSNP